MRAENGSSFLSLLRMPPTLLFWNPTLQSTWYLWYQRKLISLLVRAESQLPNQCIIYHTLRVGEHTHTHTQMRSKHMQRYTVDVCKCMHTSTSWQKNLQVCTYTRILSITCEEIHVVHTESHMHATITFNHIQYGYTHTHAHIFLLLVRWNTRCLFADGWQH